MWSFTHAHKHPHDNSLMTIYRVFWLVYIIIILYIENVVCFLVQSNTLDWWTFYIFLLRSYYTPFFIHDYTFFFTRHFFFLIYLDVLWGVLSQFGIVAWTTLANNSEHPTLCFIHYYPPQIWECFFMYTHGCFSESEFYCWYWVKFNTHMWGHFTIDPGCFPF